MFQNLAKTFHHEAFRNGRTQGNAVTNAERTRRVLDTESHIYLGVARRARTQLAEILDVVHGEPTHQGQFGIEKRAHVAGVHKEPVAGHPVRIVGVEAQELGIEKRYGVGSSHGATRMTGLGLLDHGGGKDTDIVCGFGN